MAFIDKLTPRTFSWPHVRYLDADSVLVLDRVREADGALRGKERACARAMSAMRLREFASGRRVARRALALLGEVENVDIPIGRGGEPLWPEGVTGSLSHTTSHAGVLVARRKLYPSVGIDLDDQRLLGPKAAAGLMTDKEIAAVLTQRWTTDEAVAQNIVFIAKEAVFKYQYPLTGLGDLGFDEVRLAPSGSVSYLSAVSLNDDARLSAALAGCRVYYEEIQEVRISWVLATA